MDVVKDDGFPIAWCLCQPYIPWNNGLKHLLPVEVPQIAGNRRRQFRAFVIHGQQEALNHKVWVVMAPDACERVEQFRDALEGVVLALNGDDK